MKDSLLPRLLERATAEHFAIGHFNISTLEFLQGIVEGVRRTQFPVLIGLSEGERKHIGLHQAVCLVRTHEMELGIPLVLNADHSKSVETACAAADAGFDSIHIDASEHPYETNIEMTRRVVVHAKEIAPSISVEGELGFVPGESKVSDTRVPVDESAYTNPEKIAEFIERTGIDRLAIFVGNIHGLHRSEPKLDIDRIRAIRKAAPQHVALVLHAGSGIMSDDLYAAIDAGIANIHISTELRLLFTEMLRAELQKNPNETTPYKYLASAVHGLADLVEQKIIAFARGKSYSR